MFFLRYLAVLTALVWSSPAHAALELKVVESSSRVIAPGAAAHLAFDLTYRGDQPWSGKLSWEVRDYWDQVQHSETIPLVLGLDSLNIVERDVTLDQPGYYSVKVTAAADGATTDTPQRTWSVAVLAAAPQPAAGRFGTYTIGSFHMLREITPRGYFNDLKQAGVRWGTIDAWWANIEPVRDQYNWEAYDRWFQAALAEGIVPIPHLYGTPLWNTTRGENAPPSYEEYPPADWDQWEQFVRDFVTRYGDWLVYLRIWNEPNTGYWKGTPQEYAKLVEIASRAARAVKPDIKIIIEAVESKGHDAVGYLESVAPFLPATAWDIAGVHNYRLNDTTPPEQTEFMNVYPRFKAWRDRTNPHAEIWDTEFACMADDWGKHWKGVGETHQAQWLVRTHAIGFAQGLEKMFWFPAYSWPDPTMAPHYNPAGLLRTDLTPRPAYVAYGVMAAQLAEAAFAQSLQPGTRRHACVFHKAEGFVSLVWAEDGSAAGEQVLRFAPGETLRIVDLMGRTREIAADPRGEVRLTIGEDALYIHSKTSPDISLEPSSGN